MDTTTLTLLGVVDSADVGLCWQLCANGHNNCQHCWELLVLQMLDCVGSCVQMNTTTPTLLGVVGSADVGLCWQLLRPFAHNQKLCIMVSHKVTIREFTQRKTSRKWKLEKIFLGHLQPPQG